MLGENIKALRKKKGLSQQELAVELNVVRQTVSKWEQGLSVPDAHLLSEISRILESPVHVLLGEAVDEKEDSELQIIARKLEVINLQLQRQSQRKEKIWNLFLALVLAGTLLMAFVLLALDSPYLGWDYTNPEMAVLGTLFHAFEWGFARLFPLLLLLVFFLWFLPRRRTRD